VFLNIASGSPSYSLNGLPSEFGSRRNGRKLATVPDHGFNAVTHCFRFASEYGHLAF
jgi:hypothetical protein